MARIVTSPDQVVTNVRRFADELARSPHLQARLGTVHAWYALCQEDGRWIFGPSKFVGYQDNTAEEYLRTYRSGAAGRQTEHVLAKWFSPVDPSSRLGLTLRQALRDFLAQWDRKPRSDARISVVSEEQRDSSATKGVIDDAMLSRISSDPEVCGGRPCIKGTRVRVSDIVEMLAHGASKDEILADYPYLSDEDIRAALAYAARSADHRVIRAA